MRHFSVEKRAKLDRRMLCLLTIVTCIVAVAVALFNPGQLSFRPFTLTEFLQLVSPLMMVALFIERVLEVFLASWRTGHAMMSNQQTDSGGHTGIERLLSEPTPLTDTQIRSQTRRVAFVAGTAIGAIVAALGVRVLESIVDVNAFAALPQVHQRVFRTADVLMTGAVLGGGSDAIHQLVRVFTNFFQSAAGRVKKGGPARRQTT